MALKSIEALDSLSLERDIRSERCEACRAILPVLITMEYARKLGARRGVPLRQANSGDTAGPKNQVVGYAALAFYAEGAGGGKQAAPREPKAPGGGRLDAKARAELLGIARRAIEGAVRDGRAREPGRRRGGVPAALRPPSHFFVYDVPSREVRGEHAHRLQEQQEARGPLAWPGSRVVEVSRGPPPQ